VRVIFQISRFSYGPPGGEARAMPCGRYGAASTLVLYLPDIGARVWQDQALERIVEHWSLHLPQPVTPGWGGP